MRIGLVIAAGALVLLAACGQPATPPQSAGSTTTNATVNTPEGAFLTNAAMFENFAIQAAQLAETNGQSQAVKTYAAAALSEHRAMLAQLNAAAQASGISAPNDALDENYQAYLNMLRSQNPAGFDTTYASQLSIAYVSASGQYDTFVASADDSPLKTWAADQTQRLHDGIAAAHALAAGTTAQ